MKLVKLILVCSFSLFVYSCTTSEQKPAVSKKSDSVSLKAWIGKPISDVLKHPKFGVPNSKETIGNDVVITYKQLFSASGYLSDNSLSVNLFCSRSFVYGGDLKINDVLEEGSCQNGNNLLPIEEEKK